MEITHRTDSSFATRVVQTCVSPFGSWLITPRSEYPKGSPKIDIAKISTQTTDVTERQVEGVYLYDISATSTGSRKPESSDGTAQQRIYYFPGGGWQMPASPGHWQLCKAFVAELPNTTVTLVSYPLAPNSPAPDTFPQLVKLYYALVEESYNRGERIVLAGDSAGGNIALSLTLHVLSTDQNAKAPAQLLAITPCCDLRHLDETDAKLKEIAKQDPILRIPSCNLTSDAWRGSWDASDPRVSVVLADVSILASRDVQVYGITGSHDILAPGAEIFRDLCVEAGVHGKWLSWKGQMHIFPLFWALGMKESKEAKSWILDALRNS